MIDENPDFQLVTCPKCACPIIAPKFAEPVAEKPVEESKASSVVYVLTWIIVGFLFTFVVCLLLAGSVSALRWADLL